MKSYRIFIIDLGILPSDYENCYALSVMGLGNVDGFFYGSTVRCPTSAVWHIRQSFSCLHPLKEKQIKKIISSDQNGMFFGKIQSNIQAYHNFFDFAKENAADNDLFFYICRHRDSADSAVMISGNDIIPVNLATADSFDQLYATADVLFQSKSSDMKCDVVNHIIYSDQYIKRKGKQDV